MKKNILALIDVNNFYVSCEKAFVGALQTKPTIVLLNNDGCVVARSNDVKQWIKMGQPVFEVEDIIKEHDIQVYSSNYTLYATMSDRFMRLLSQFSPTVEVYSIDEAFADLTHLSIDDLTDYAKTIKARIFQFVSLPVSVSIAPTKCLCKIANELVKHDPSYEGVLDLTALPEDEVDTLLSQVAIEDVWGIGRKYASFLQNHGIMTAKDLKYADEQWIRTYLTVTGHRIVLELRGLSCMPIEIVRPTKKGIMCAKTFGQEIQEYTELAEAVACYVARVAEKLRSQDSQAAFLTVFVRTSYFNKTTPHYENSYSIRLPFATAFTPDLIVSALRGLKAIFQDGFKYKKAGVLLSKITPHAHVQPDLFGDVSLFDYYRKAKLMAVVDAINAIYGHDSLFFAVQGSTRPWKMRQSQLSGRFTTQWSEILTIL
jgi:DNA polymerase V